MAVLRNQGERRDEFGITYQLLINEATGRAYHAYTAEALEERRAHLESVAVPGQPQRYPVLDQQAVADPAPQG